MPVKLDGEPQMAPILFWFWELLPTKHAVMIYDNIWKDCKHIRIKSDNTTAISYINNKGRIVSDSVIIYQKQYGIIV